MLGRLRKARSHEDPETRILSQIAQLERTLLNTQKKGDLTEESRLCNNIAKQWESIGEWRKALQFHLFDKQISDAAGDAEGYCMAVGNMAQVFVEYNSLFLFDYYYFRMGLNGMAKDMRREQLKWARRSQEPVSIFRVFVAMGLAKLAEAETSNLAELLRRELLSEAAVNFFHAQEALDSYEALITAGLLVKSRKKEAEALKRELDLYDCRLLALKGNGDAALAKLLLLEQWSKEYKDDTFLFQVLGVKGMAYQRMNEHNSAIERCYDRQLEIARRLDSVEMEIETLYNLFTAYKRLGDYELAVKTLYLHKDLVKLQVFDEARMKEVDEEIKELLDLKETQSRMERIKTKMIKSKNPEKYFRELAVDCKKLGAYRECLEYALSELEQNEGNEDCLFLTIEALLEEKHAKDAIYYCQKLLCIYEGKGVRGEKVANVLLLLAKAYWLLPTLPGEVLQTLQRAISIIEGHNEDQTVVMECISLLALSYARLGVDEMYVKERDRCMAKYNELMATLYLKDEEISNELASLDYFATRKASKSVMRLVDGQFNMKSRTKSNLRGPKIRATRIKKDSDSDEDIRRPRVVRKSSRIVGSDEDLSDFVVNDDEVVMEPTKRKESLIILSEFEDDTLLPPPPYKERNFMDDFHVDDYHSAGELIWPPSPKKTLSHSEVSIDGGKKKQLTTPFMDPGVIASVLRLFVLVDGHDPLIIPVVDDITERKTISWLMEEIKHRFRVDFDKEPIIEALYTENGARLSSLDPVALILSDNQRVHVRISGFKTKTFKEILDAMLAEADVSFDTIFYGMLVKGVEEGSVDLSNWRWLDHWLSLTLRSLIYYVTLRPNGIHSINLCNNQLINDVQLVEFLTLVGSHVNSLDLSFTQINSSFPDIPTTFPSLHCLKMSFVESSLLENSTFLDTLTRKISKLKHLELCGVDLQDAGIECLHYLTSLETVDLSFSVLPREGPPLQHLLTKSASIKNVFLADEESVSMLSIQFPRIKFMSDNMSISVIK